MRIVYGRASAAIANSRNTARLLEGTGWHHGSVDVVYPGVDATRFRPDAKPLGLRQRLGAPDALILMSVARLQRRKGHDLVIRALPELLRQWPMTRYVIVGDGNERRALEALTTSLGVERAVHFTGEVIDDDLPSYFAEADVFVLPTRVEASDFEGFGIVFLEAAAAAKPSVGGRNGGVPEAIVEGETGMLVEQDDLASLTRILLQLLGSPELRHRLGEAGRSRAVRDFDWNDAARSVMKIHERIANM
jgi:phosphatidylinositol alpha-1,6-mannosyltransferase